MKTNIHIPNPCHENWNSMEPDKGGKFCNSCSKTVIDFTKMKNQEIQKYFIDHSETDTICGRFKLNQVDSENDRINNLKNRFQQIKITPIRKLAFFSMGILLSMTSCIMGKAAKEIKIEEIESGDTIIIKNDQQTEKANDSVKQENAPVKKN